MLIPTAMFGAIAGASIEAAGIASARPNQCEDDQCHAPHPPNESTHPAGSNPNLPGPQTHPPAATQWFVCDNMFDISPCFGGQL